ncbi:hypothetical protein [Flectobacillus major]|jgi:hypothetical protein|uniref:hypothetical protein n=1 Tax=Flectobacillus major TaxID=103 RepID=UPI000479AEC9|nr:hypothetical protein [Flectobacillus major]
MAKRFQVLDSFSHISNSVNHPIHALVSVQYPALNGLQSLQDSINAIFKKKRAVYVALSDQKLIHIHTVGTSVTTTQEIPFEHIQDIHIDTKSQHRDFNAPKVTVTTKNPKAKKANEKVHEFILFPSLFFPNLKYSENHTELMQFVQMREHLLEQLKQVKKTLEDKKATEAAQQN